MSDPMDVADPTDEPAPAPPSLTRSVMATVAVSGLWIVLALIRDATTFHLAPVLVVLAAPWFDATANGPRSRRPALIAAGTVAALAGGALLEFLGALDGGYLIGANAFQETMVVAAVSGVVAFAYSALGARR